MGDVEYRDLKSRLLGNYAADPKVQSEAADELTRLRARVAALEADKKRLVAVLEDAKGTLGMLRSIIDSGERWTGRSTSRYFDTITTIRAELDAVKGGGDA